MGAGANFRRCLGVREEVYPLVQNTEIFKVAGVAVCPCALPVASVMAFALVLRTSTCPTGVEGTPPHAVGTTSDAGILGRANFEAGGPRPGARTPRPSCVAWPVPPPRGMVAWFPHVALRPLLFVPPCSMHSGTRGGGV